MLASTLAPLSRMQWDFLLGVCAFDNFRRRGTGASMVDADQHTGLASQVFGNRVLLQRATNHVSLAAPCHQLVGSDGALAGHGWGVPRKRALLGGEKAVANQG